jgi:hypothetical protein
VGRTLEGRGLNLGVIAVADKKGSFNSFMKNRSYNSDRFKIELGGIA